MASGRTPPPLPPLHLRAQPIGSELGADFSVVTTDEVRSAFSALEEGVAGHISAQTLRRAVSSARLLRRPLNRSEADVLLRTVGVDGRGLVSCARFNASLGVLPALPAPPKPPSCCRRLLSRCFRRTRSTHARANGGQGAYLEADLSDDGTSEGLRPISL